MLHANMKENNSLMSSRTWGRRKQSQTQRIGDQMPPLPVSYSNTAGVISRNGLKELSGLVLLRRQNDFRGRYSI